MLGFVPLLTKVAHGGNPRRESGISWGDPSISSRKDRTFALPNLQIGDRASLLILLVERFVVLLILILVIIYLVNYHLLA